MEGRIVNPVRQAVDDTKDDGVPGQTQGVRSNPGIMVEPPEDVIKRFQFQATYLGPVMEEILHASHGQGWDHWGLNE